MFKARRTVASLTLLLFALVWGLGQEAAARSPVPTTEDLAAMGLEARSVQVGQLKRHFLVLPPDDSERAAAVLIVLHGGTQSMRRIFAPDAGATRGWPALARRENVLLLVPNAVDPETGDPGSDSQNWNDLRRNVSKKSTADDVRFMKDLIIWAKANHNIDRRRIYVTGASNGGMMTFRLLMEMPDSFAAAASMVASLPADMTVAQTPAQSTPLMIGHGTLDPLVKWEGGRIAGDRGEMQSVADTVNWWIAANKANSKPARVRTIKDRDPGDNCKIIERTYRAKAGGADIVTLEMQGGGHNIPSARYPLADRWIVRRLIGPVCKDAEGIELIWRFLSGYERVVK
jgi:polyhydroxybutyrate depolymerase